MWWDDAYGWGPPTSALVAALGRRSRTPRSSWVRTLASTASCSGSGSNPAGRVSTRSSRGLRQFERLRQNLELNDVADRVVVWPVAAGQEEGTMTLYVPPPLAENSGIRDIGVPLRDLSSTARGRV